jgi:Domain of unknown function (DUF4203)
VVRETAANDGNRVGGDAMKDVIVGLLALGTGALFCFRGYVAMRLVIPVWGLLVGFFFGAGLVARIADEHLLATLTGWLVGIACALLFGLIAYLYYEVSVVLGMAGIGFSLGTAVMVALGVHWSWLVILVGLVAAVGLAYFAIVADVPLLLLVVLSATAGAVAMVAGAMLIFGAVDLNEFDAANTTELIDDSWFWYAGYVIAAVAGVAIQVRDLSGLSGGLRSQWSESGGRQFRAG